MTKPRTKIGDGMPLRAPAPAFDPTLDDAVRATNWYDHFDCPPPVVDPNAEADECEADTND